jgi:hypothetical protein
LLTKEIVFNSDTRHVVDKLLPAISVLFSKSPDGLDDEDVDARAKTILSNQPELYKLLKLIRDKFYSTFGSHVHFLNVLESIRRKSSPDTIEKLESIVREADNFARFFKGKVDFAGTRGNEIKLVFESDEEYVYFLKHVSRMLSDTNREIGHGINISQGFTFNRDF